MSNNNYYACKNSPRPCSSLPYFTGVSAGVCEQFIVDRGLRLVYAQYGLHKGSILHLRVNVVSKVGSWPDDPPFPSQQEITKEMTATDPSLTNSQYAIADASNAAYVFINKRAAHGEIDCSDNMTNVWFQELRSSVSSEIYTKWWDIGVDSMGDAYFYERCSGTYDCPPGTHLTSGHCCPIGSVWNILTGNCDIQYDEQGPVKPTPPEIRPSPTPEDPDGDGNPGGDPLEPGTPIDCIVSAKCDLPIQIELSPDDINSILPPGYDQDFDSEDTSDIIEGDCGVISEECIMPETKDNDDV